MEIIDKLSIKSKMKKIENSKNPISHGKVAIKGFAYNAFHKGA